MLERISYYFLFGLKERTYLHTYKLNNNEG